MDELVKKLCQGQHPIAAERSDSARGLQEQIDRGFVLLKFTETKGGTELGSQLDKELTQLGDADFEKGTGIVHLVGNLTLNYDKVQLVADVSLATLKGTGHLVLIEVETDVSKRASSTKKSKKSSTKGGKKSSIEEGKETVST